MKSLLVYASEDTALDSRLGAAIDVARSFEAHLTCLQVTPFDAFLFGDPFGGVYALPTIIEEMRAAEEAHRARIEAKLEREGISWDWRHCDGQPAKMVVRHSRLADLIVLSLPRRDGRATGAPLSLTADVAVHARSPVLAVPTDSKAFDCLGPALVAWNGSSEAAHALRFAPPMLERASAVHVVTVVEDVIDFPSIDPCEYLARHGIGAELHEWSLQGRAVAEAICDAVLALGANYVVMGAYGHTRAREAVLGGATRNMLDMSEVPLLLGH